MNVGTRYLLAALLLLGNATATAQGRPEVARLPAEAAYLVFMLAQECDHGDEDRCVDLARHYLEGLLAPGWVPPEEVAAVGFGVLRRSCARGHLPACQLGADVCDAPGSFLGECRDLLDTACEHQQEGCVGCCLPLGNMNDDQLSSLSVVLDGHTRASAAIEGLVASIVALPPTSVAAADVVPLQETLVDLLEASDDALAGLEALEARARVEIDPGTDEACRRALEPVGEPGLDDPTCLEMLSAVDRCADGWVSALSDARGEMIGLPLGPRPELPEALRLLSLAHLQQAEAPAPPADPGRPLSLAELMETANQDLEREAIARAEPFESCEALLSTFRRIHAGELRLRDLGYAE